jgi:hypothetical protein
MELRLVSNLKQYFTLAVELFAQMSLKSDIALSFLSRWPSLDHLPRSNTRSLRAFFYAHNCRSNSLIAKRLELIARAQNVPADPALIEPFIITTKCLVAQLRHFNRAIKEFDQRIAQLFCSHPDRFIFESFPGAGRQMAPRLLSAFGSDRSRWPDCTHIQRYSGIAPVIERSGKSLWVHQRFGRPKFLPNLSRICSAQHPSLVMVHWVFGSRSKKSMARCLNNTFATFRLRCASGAR